MAALLTQSPNQLFAPTQSNDLTPEAMRAVLLNALMQQVPGTTAAPAPQTSSYVPVQANQPGFNWRNFLNGAAQGMANYRPQPRFYGSTWTDVGRSQGDYLRGEQDKEIAKERNNLMAAQEANRVALEKEKNNLLVGEMQQRRNDAEQERSMRIKIAETQAGLDKQRIENEKKALEEQAKILEQRTTAMSPGEARLKETEAAIKAERENSDIAQRKASDNEWMTGLNTIADNVEKELPSNWFTGLSAPTRQTIVNTIRSGDLPQMEALLEQYPTVTALNNAVSKVKLLHQKTNRQPSVIPNALFGPSAPSMSVGAPAFQLSPDITGMAPSGPTIGNPALRFVRDPQTGRLVIAQ